MKKTVFYETKLNFEKNNWFHVFSAALGRSALNQNIFMNLIGETTDWSVDLEKGLISFGKKMFPVQVIGSESNVSNSWRWAWDNRKNLSDRVLRVADEMKTLGDAWTSEPLTTPSFDLTEYFNGHNLAMTVCALSKENLCYYRCPHDKGAFLLAFPLDDEVFFQPISMEKFITLTMECLKKFAVDHRIFVESLLYQNETPFHWEGNTLTAHFSQDLQIEYEQKGDFWLVTSIKTI